MLTLALLIEKSKADETPWEKKKKKKRKKNRPREERKGTTLSSKEKRFFRSGALIYAGVQISNKEVAVKPKFTIRDVKSEVSFSLCKYEP